MGERCAVDSICLSRYALSFEKPITTEYTKSMTSTDMLPHSLSHIEALQAKGLESGQKKIMLSCNWIETLLMASMTHSYDNALYLWLQKKPGTA